MKKSKQIQIHSLFPYSQKTSSTMRRMMKITQGKHWEETHPFLFEPSFVHHKNIIDPLFINL